MTETTARAARTTTAAGLHVTEWPGSGPTVVGLPGLGSTGHVWTPLATALGDARVVAPDLRGRGGSSSAGGASGLRAHAADVAALLEELDLRDVVLVGHSMGAFLAPVVAQQAQGRVARLVLLDGGVPPKLPFFLGPRTTGVVFRRDLRKLDRAWPDARGFVQEVAGKALANRPDLVDEVVALTAHDLVGEPGRLRPRLDVDLAVADAVDTFHGPSVVPALEALSVPAHLIAASHGKHDRAKAFLSDATLAPWASRLTVERVDANHLTLLFSPEVPRAVAG